jgi:hypothetical protein
VWQNSMALKILRLSAKSAGNIVVDAKPKLQ